MKQLKYFLSGVLMVAAVAVSAQDSSGSHGWNVTLGLDIGAVPTYKIIGTDTNTVNTLGLAPSLALTHSSGFGITYSPALLVGGMSPGLYLHKFRVGYAQYDKETMDVAVDYNHYFFTKNAAVPYSPISNELSLDLVYKKWWLRPGFSTSVGFGTDRSGKTPESVTDIAAAFGFSHSFDWDKGENSFSLVPGVSLNAGTNQYFSFLNSTRYISNSKKFTNYVSKGAGASRGKSKKAGSGGTFTTTNSTSSTNFELSNIELHLSGSYEHGRFTMRPEASLYLPVGTASDAGVSGYWGISLQYKLTDN